MFPGPGEGELAGRHVILQTPHPDHLVPPSSMLCTFCELCADLAVSSLTSSAISVNGCARSLNFNQSYLPQGMPHGWVDHVTVNSVP